MERNENVKVEKKHKASRWSRKRKDTEKEMRESVSRYVDEGNPNTKNPVTQDHEQKIPGAGLVAETPFELSSTTVQQMGDPIHRLNDEQLVQEIQTAIQKEDSISDEAKEGVAVMVEEGMVVLEGSVPTREERMTIDDKAVAFTGVGKVKNNLKVIEEMEEDVD